MNFEENDPTRRLAVIKHSHFQPSEAEFLVCTWTAVIPHKTEKIDLRVGSIFGPVAIALECELWEDHYQKEKNEGAVCSHADR
jgi:hypothetical protein